jgi:Tfp pilus assembly protein PilW
MPPERSLRSLRERVTLRLALDPTFAATKLAKNSVGATQIKKNAVVTAKIKNAAVTNSKLAANAVTTGKIADGEVRATDLGTIVTAQKTVQIEPGLGGTNDAAGQPLTAQAYCLVG